jgi:hypothetical protein
LSLPSDRAAGDEPLPYETAASPGVKVCPVACVMPFSQQ